MEGLVWLVVLCTLTAALLAVQGICRRMLSHDLPQQLTTWVALQESETISMELETLASQLAWMDSALIQQVWLVDCTIDGSLEEKCMAFCQRHNSFSYCRLSELVKIFGKMGEAEKNNCISSKKHV